MANGKKRAEESIQLVRARAENERLKAENRRLREKLSAALPKTTAKDEEESE